MIIRCVLCSLWGKKKKKKVQQWLKKIDYWFSLNISSLDMGFHWQEKKKQQKACLQLLSIVVCNRNSSMGLSSPPVTLPSQRPSFSAWDSGASQGTLSLCWGKRFLTHAKDTCKSPWLFIQAKVSIQPYLFSQFPMH